MKNLAGITKCDQYILEELYHTLIPAVKCELTNTEVPYTYIGKIGNWIFTRAWTYWIATAPDGEGLLEADAEILHLLKHPITGELLNTDIRCDGFAGGAEPSTQSAPKLTPELHQKMRDLGFDDKVVPGFNQWVLPTFSVSDIRTAIKEGKIDPVPFTIDCYHIDTLIGLNEFVKFITK